MRTLIALGLLASLAAAPKAHAEVFEPACTTPRDAVYTLLYFLQDNDERDPGKAALCISREGLKKPASQAPRIAIQLKRILDARDLYVMVDEIPKEPEFKNDKGKSRYSLFPDDLRGMTWERDAKGSWLLTPDARESVQKIYDQTFPVDMAELVEGWPEWTRWRMFGVHMWQVVGVFILLILAMLTRLLLMWVSARYIRRYTKNLHTKWVDATIDTVDNPLGVLVAALVISLLFPVLQFPLAINTVAMLAARVLAAFSVVWLGYRMVDVISGILAERAEKTETKLDDQLVPLIRKTLKLFFSVIGGIFILQNLNIDVGSLLAGLGIGGLAFALAAKDTVANLFGSLMIFIDKPFQIGDWIVVGSGPVEGSVEEVGFRTTRIRTFYNSLVTVPNSVITNSNIDNMGMRQYRRYKTSLGIHYDTPPEKVQAFCDGIRALISNTDGMRKDFYLVEFHSLGQSELNILIYSFLEVPDWQAELTTRSNLNLGILRLAQAMGVVFAYPTQSLHIDSTPDKAKTLSTVPNDERLLEEIVDSFAQGGKRSLPRGKKLTHGYYAGQPTKEGSHEEIDEG